VSTSPAAGLLCLGVGHGRDPEDKAQRDYRKRVNGSTRDERVGVVFVFVTSRRSPGAQGWVDRRTEDDDGAHGVIGLRD
jgi:hypothetical protein